MYSRLLPQGEARTAKRVQSVKQPHVKCNQWYVQCIRAFSATFTVLTSLYSVASIPDGGYKVICLDSVHTGRYSKCFDV